MQKELLKYKDLPVFFIDHTKAFDIIRYAELTKLLQALSVDGKDLKIIKKLHWDQTAAIRDDNELGNFVKIKRGVRQGCVLSPEIFSPYSEYIMRDIEDLPGIKIGGRNINNLRYSDDTALIATSEAALQNLLNIINEKSESLRLGLNIKKDGNYANLQES